MMSKEQGVESVTVAVQEAGQSRALADKDDYTSPGSLVTAAVSSMFYHALP